MQSLAGLPSFLAYFCTASVITIGYLYVYTLITPHDELELIRESFRGPIGPPTPRPNTH